MKRMLFPLLLLAAAACERGAEEVPPEVLEARRNATRMACLSAELARGAQEDLETLSGLGEGGVVEYARAFQQHALLRQAAYAQADSALNQARGREDSLAHVRAAERFAIRTPEPGTVEANVIADYERKMAALLADEDHPCNWDLDEE